MHNQRRHIVQVHSVNLNNNNTFKAKFINDNNGYFRKLWMESSINSKLGDAIDYFSKNNADHTLEITDCSVDRTLFTVFNHKNGYSRVFKVTFSANKKLQDLLEQINNSSMFEDKYSRVAKMYQKLTGQKVTK